MQYIYFRLTVQNILPGLEDFITDITCIIQALVIKQEAQLSQRDRAMLRVIAYFAESLSHPKSFKMVPFESLNTVSHFIAIMAVSLAVSEIFSVKKWRDLEI